MGGTNVYDIARGLDFVVARGIASLAVQPIMGLLPEWWSGVGAGDFDPSNSGSRNLKR